MNEKIMTNELYHHGILGMKWGVRRYQNKDGTLTDLGKKRYYDSEGNLKRKGEKAVDKQYNKLNKSKKIIRQLDKKKMVKAFEKAKSSQLNLFRYDPYSQEGINAAKKAKEDHDVVKKMVEDIVLKGMNLKEESLVGPKIIAGRELVDSIMNDASTIHVPNYY